MDYRKRLAEMLEQGPSQYEQMYEQSMIEAPTQRSLRPTSALVDAMTGSNFVAVSPEGTNAKDRFAELAGFKQGQQNRKIDGLTKLAQMQANQEDRNLDRMIKMAALKDKLGAGGKQLSANEVAKFNEANTIPRMLDDLKLAIENNKGMYGPIIGRIGEKNPYSKKGQAVAANLKMVAQKIGTYLEGGKLQAADEIKYQNMLPKLTDTPEVAQSKLNDVYRLVAQKQQADIEALRGAGYNVDSIDKNLEIPELSQLVTGGRVPASAPRVAKGTSLKGLDFDSMSDEELDAYLSAIGR